MPRGKKTPAKPSDPTDDLQEPGFSSVEKAVEDFRAGRFVIVVDDDDRENEGDLIIAAEHVNDIGLGAATDDAIAAYALTSSVVIVTKDADFATLGRHDARLRVVWIRVGNATAAALWRAVEPCLAEIETALQAGDMLIEIR